MEKLENVRAKGSVKALEICLVVSIVDDTNLTGWQLWIPGQKLLSKQGRGCHDPIRTTDHQTLKGRLHPESQRSWPRVEAIFHPWIPKISHPRNTCPGPQGRGDEVCGWQGACRVQGVNARLADDAETPGHAEWEPAHDTIGHGEDSGVVPSHGQMAAGVHRECPVHGDPGRNIAEEAMIPLVVEGFS